MTVINAQNIFNHPILKDFLRINAHKILYHNTSSYYLTNQYINDPQFLNEWQEVLTTADPDYKSGPNLNSAEYLYQLLPVFFTSLTAFFGLLLGLSNLPAFADLMGNFTVVKMFFSITLTAVVVSTYAIYRQIRFNEQRAAFTNWFFLGLIYYISFLETHTLVKDDVCRILTKELQNFYQDLHNQLLNNKFLLSTETLKSKLLKLIQLSPPTLDTKSLTQLSNFLKIEADVHEKIDFKHHELTIHHPSPKNKILEVMGKTWDKLKQLVASHALIWEITVGNVAMCAGLVGVTIGTVKTYAHYFKKENITALIMTPTVTIVALIVMAVVLVTHSYCRLKGQKFHTARKEMSNQQVVILNDCFQIVRNLKKL